MKKILLISAVFPPEPVVSARLSADIAAILSKKHQVTVLCPPPSRPLGFVFKQIPDKLPYKLVYTESFTCPESKLRGRIKESYSFGREAARYIRANANEIDCIYANVWPLLSQYMIVKAAKKLDVPCMLHIQDIYPESLTYKMNPFTGNAINFFVRTLDKRIIQLATKVAGISDKMITYLVNSRKVDLEKFILIRNWQDDSVFLQIHEPEKTRDEFIFMFVGSLSPTAALPTLIKAFHKAALPKTRLIIAGTGAEEEVCLKLVEELNQKQIDFISVSPEDVPVLQSQADVLLLPLKKNIAYTATPSKLISYLLSAKAVLACVEADTDTAEIISNATCGLVANPEDTDSIANLMQVFYRMPITDLRQMGGRGRTYALQYLTKDVNLSKLSKEIEKLIV